MCHIGAVVCLGGGFVHAALFVYAVFCWGSFLTTNLRRSHST